MVNLRYALSEIRDNWRDTYWWRKRFLTHGPSRYFRRFRQPDSPRVHELDWDTLVILDACRYDLFAETYTEYDVPGTLDRRKSLEAGTPGFLRENFDSSTFHDTVYVTANAYVNTLLDDGTFHDVVPAWRDHWDDDLQTVTPETMTDLAVEAAERYPDKRLIVHFVQPHEPFIGDIRLDIREKSAIREEALGHDPPSPQERVPTSFEQLARGELDRDEVWAAYRSNLERALSAVERLLADIEGKTAITADHGNAFGEFAWPFPIRVYGHPLGILIPALVDVPYLTHTNGPRRRVVAEEPTTTGAEASEEAAERLRMLGYAE